MWEHTQNLALELSNFCNLHHAPCPVVYARGRVTLPSATVRRCLGALRDYRGSISFHQYNEPLLDPRLFLFLEWTRVLCPENPINLVTNGTNLTVQLARELAAFGNIYLYVSLYGELANPEIAKILPTHFVEHGLDDRLGIYDRPSTGCTRPCGAPLNRVVVTCRGDVALCCHDWKRTVTFGNVGEDSLKNILASDRVQNVYRELSAGTRNLDVCQRCNVAR